MTDAIRPETVLLRGQILLGEKMKRAALASTAAPWQRISVDPPKGGKSAGKAALEKYRQVGGVVGAQPSSVKPFEMAEPVGRPPEREPILVHLSHAELEHCQTWEGMQALLGMKGVPYDRLAKADGSPADVRVDEREDGLMVEIE